MRRKRAHAMDTLQADALDFEAQKVKAYRLAKEAEALAEQLLTKAQELREELEHERLGP